MKNQGLSFHSISVVGSLKNLNDLDLPNRPRKNKKLRILKHELISITLHSGHHVYKIHVKMVCTYAIVDFFSLLCDNMGFSILD